MNRNAVAYGFRDDITDEELDELIVQGDVFECSEHGVLESTMSFTGFDAKIALMRREKETTNASRG